MPPKGRYRLRDYEKTFCPDLTSHNHIFDMRGIDRNRGAWLSFDRTVTLRMFCRSMPMPSSKHSSMDLCCKGIEFSVSYKAHGSANQFALSRNAGSVERGPVAKRR